MARPYVTMLSCILLVGSSARASVYVGHSGCSDAGPGTADTPLCSIESAVEKARGSSSDKDVVLEGGTFTLSKAIQLTAADTGLTLRAADGKRVKVSGGVAVTGWSESATTGVWSAPVPAPCGCTQAGGCGPTSCMGYSSPRQIYVNDHRANRTSANATTLLGAISLTQASSPQSPAGMVTPGGAYTVQHAALKGAKGDIEMVYPAQIVPWTEPRCGVKSISADGLTLHMKDCISRLPPKPGCTGTVNATLCPMRWFMAGLPGLVENVFELLGPSTHGQFYIDRAEAKVYYTPHPSEDMTKAVVIMPLLESLLLSNGAKNLNIIGIDFVHTAWGGPDQPSGYVPTQAGWAPRPVEEPHKLGPVAQQHAEPLHVGAGSDQTHSLGPPTFVIGAGGSAPFLDSKGGPASMHSHSGTAVMSMQGDANLCTEVFASQNCTSSGCPVSQHFCLGAPTCPCAPKCAGAQKLPPYCNSSSPAGYKLVVTGAAANDVNLCVQDTQTKTNRWCALPDAAGSAAPPSTDAYLMLGDDGSICLHAGKYVAGDSAAHATLWCHASPGGGAGAGVVSKQIPAGVRLNNTVNTVITRCTFAHMGGAGLDLYGGSQHTAVTGSYAHDISGTAIQFGGIVPCPACPTKLPCGVSAGTSGTSCPTTLPSPVLDLNLTFTDNVIADVTREFHGCLGVWGGYMRQTTFSHNDICRTAYGGLSLGWGWAIPWQNTYQRENEISYNHITHWMGVLDDSGATYTLGPHMNSSLHHNYAAHAGEIGIVAGGPTGPSGSGIEPGGSAHGGAYYPDDGSAFWHIHDNVAEDLHGGEWLFAWNAADQHDLTVDTNYVDTTKHICASATCTVSATVVVNRSITPPEPWPAAAQRIMSEAGARAGKLHPDAAGACK